MLMLWRWGWGWRGRCGAVWMETSVRRRADPAARSGAAPPRPAPRCYRDPAADHFQGGPGSRFENAGAAAGAPVRAGAAAAAARRGHGWERERQRERRRRRGLGRAAAARMAPALLQPAAEAAHDGDRGGAAMGGTWGQRHARTGSRVTEGAGMRGTRGSHGNTKDGGRHEGCAEVKGTQRVEDTGDARRSGDMEDGGMRGQIAGTQDGGSETRNIWT